MPAVLIQNPLPVVDQHDPGASGTQRGDAGGDAREVGLGVRAVRHDPDVGVDDQGSAHLASRWLRRTIACWVLAISPNSSPKNPSGQFSIVPKMSS